MVDPRILVVGGGIAGLATARALLGGLRATGLSMGVGYAAAGRTV
jgi:cation diffusion facilitator CzcD-associated flavoprotein CzcO